MLKIAKKGKPAVREPIFIEKVLKGDTFKVMADARTELEDEFNSDYYRVGGKGANKFLLPPYIPMELQQLTLHNNTLGQCVEAMEVNIDGTGYEFVSEQEGSQPPPTEVERLRGFFEEPSPGENFITLRRATRRDMEQVGWAIWEILRNLQGEMVGVRMLVTSTMRMVKLDEPVMVSQTITRNGAEIEMTMMKRERRWAQCLVHAAGGNNKYLHFKEYGSSRDLDKETGEWAPQGTVLPADKKASEVLVFGVHPDVATPYFLPRWINNTPAVVGSRKAEEENLHFFDAGGLPPAMILVTGGTMGTATSDQLKAYLSGMNKHRHRAIVVEVASTSGDIDKSSPVGVHVERFGGEGKNDPMFDSYDEQCQDKVLRAFRLPGLFIGKMQDMSLASAVTAYMVAEAQVFGPERIEFDSIINRTIMKELKAKGVRFRSLPITLTNVDARLRALALAGPQVTGKSYIDELNKTAGTSLEFVEPKLIGGGLSISPFPDADAALPAVQELLDQTAENASVMADALQGATGNGEATDAQNSPDAAETAQSAGEGPSGNRPAQDATTTPKEKGLRQLVRLADLYAQCYGLITQRQEFTPEAIQKIERVVSGLSPEHSEAFMQFVASMASNQPRVNEPHRH
jgi:PBSX family phage portal protein